MDIKTKIQTLQQTLNVEYTKPDVEKYEQMVANLRGSPDGTSPGYEYLTKDRGLTDETIKHFRLGYDKDKNAIAIPHFKGEELINIKYRFLKPKDIRYTSEPNAEQWVFHDEGIKLGTTKGAIAIAEGEMDCISLWQMGFKNVISPGAGANSFGPWIEHLDSIPQVWIAYDNDDPGQSAAKELAERIGTERCRNVLYPDGVKDANEFMSKFTAQDLRELFAKATPFYKYEFSGLGDVIKKLIDDPMEYLEVSLMPGVMLEKDNLIVVSGETNAGKCFAKGTKVRMYNGSVKKVEDVIVGDVLMGPDSQPRTVKKLSTGVDKMYRVWQRGEYYDVNSKHILALVDNRTSCGGGKFTMNVKDFHDDKRAIKRHFRGYRVGIEYESKELSIDPYFLGLWLGDGTEKEPEITTADNEIVRYLEKFAHYHRRRLVKKGKNNNKVGTYRISGGIKTLRCQLNELGVLGNKHIPFNYLINSRSNRLRLLGGIIDSDGFLSKNERGETIEVVQKRKRLTEDIVSLVRSLGLRAVVRSKFINGTEYYRIFITGNLPIIPSSLPRKMASLYPAKNFLTSKISVEEIGYGEYFGFEVDGDHLFLLADYTVTHNSTYSLNIVKELAERGIPTLFLPIERGVYSLGRRMLQILFNKTQSDMAFTPKEEWYTNLRSVSHLPIYMAKPSIKDLERTIVRAKRLFGVRMVIIDHIDYLIRGAMNKEALISEKMHELKHVAEQNGVIVVVVSHINRGAVQGNQRPTIKNLKGSSSLEQDSEIAIMLYPTVDLTGIEIDVQKNKGVMKKEFRKINVETGLISEAYDPENW